MIELTLDQAAEIFNFFDEQNVYGDPDAPESTVTIQVTNGHSGYGLYCYFTDYPEEGAIFLGDVGAVEEEIMEEIIAADESWTEAQENVVLTDEETPPLGWFKKVTAEDSVVDLLAALGHTKPKKNSIKVKNQKQSEVYNEHADFIRLLEDL